MAHEYRIAESHLQPGERMLFVQRGGVTTGVVEPHPVTLDEFGKSRGWLAVTSSRRLLYGYFTRFGRAKFEHAFGIKRWKEDPKGMAFEIDGGPIDLVIADVVMPGKNGITFAHTVKHTSSETRILLMGSVENDPGLRKEVTKLGFFFLAKPFTPAQLQILMTVIFEQPAPSSVEDEDSY